VTGVYCRPNVGWPGPDGGAEYGSANIGCKYMALIAAVHDRCAGGGLSRKVMDMLGGGSTRDGLPVV